MKDRVREQLLDYVLGALDAEKREEVERQLDDCPQWRDELAEIQRGLQRLSDFREDVDPPKGLAKRTCSLVDSQVKVHRVCPASVGLTAAMQPGVVSTGQGRIAEVVVSAGIFLALGLLFFPAVSNSRYVARLTQCHNNLRLLGVALATYCDRDAGDFFPAIPSTGKRAFAGIYGPMLRDAGYLRTPSLLICPSSGLVDSRDDFYIPSLDEVDAASELELVAIRRRAGGSYGYNLGYVEDGVLRSPRNAADSISR